MTSETDKLRSALAFAASRSVISAAEERAILTMVAASIADVWTKAEENHRLYSDTGDHEGDIRFLTLGLAGEAGEIMEAVLDAALVVQASGKVANLVKKRWRDGDGHDDEIRKEIADVCAYAFMLANTMGMLPSELISTIADKQAVFVAKMRARQGGPA